MRMHPGGSLDGTVADREDHTVTTTERHDLGSVFVMEAAQDWRRRDSATRRNRAAV